MKGLFVLWLIMLIAPMAVRAQDSIRILDFYPGMSKDEVEAVYNKMKQVPVAEYVTLESGQYRDQIKIDNEFSSMSNKIDIMYDDNGKATGITFQYKVVNILFKAADMNAAGLAGKLSKELGLNEFKEAPTGTGTGWAYTTGKVQITIDSYKNIRFQELATTSSVSGHDLSDTEQQIISSVIILLFRNLAEQASEPVDDTGTRSDNPIKACIVLITETVQRTYNPDTDNISKYLLGGLPGVSQSMLDDFFSRNKVTVNIPKIPEPGFPIVYLSQNEWDKIYENGGWAYYHKKYGFNPVVKFSRPGLNETRDKALLYYEAKSDKLGGSGQFILLEKVDGKWIITGTLIEWRS